MSDQPIVHDEHTAFRGVVVDAGDLDPTYQIARYMFNKISPPASP